jgi:hypothetical protein
MLKMKNEPTICMKTGSRMYNLSDGQPRFELECLAYFRRGWDHAALCHSTSETPRRAIEFSHGGVYVIARSKNLNENSGQKNAGEETWEVGLCCQEFSAVLI